MRPTRVLRVLLVLLVVLLAPAMLVLYEVGAETAREFPEFAHLHLPAFATAVVTAIPFLAAVGVVFRLLRVADDGEAFSPRTVTLLRRLAVHLTVTAAYLTAWFVGLGIAAGQTHPSLVLGWLGAEVVLVFLVMLALLLGRLFAAAVELRQDNELTV